MQYSEIVLGYLLKAQNKNVIFPQGEAQRFDLYAQLIKTPFSLNEAFVKTESLYLKKVLLEKENFTLPNGINALVGDAALFGGDAVVFSVDDTESNLFLFAGSAFKMAINKSEELPFAVYVPSLRYKNVIVNRFPKINAKATSAFVTGYITALENAVELAIEKGCKSLVYTHVELNNKLLEEQMIKSIATLFSKYYEKRKIDILVLTSTDKICELYNKYFKRKGI